MKFDGRTLGIIFTFLTSCGAGIKWTYDTAKETGELKAKVQFNKEHEKLLDELITLRVNCTK